MHSAAEPWPVFPDWGWSWQDREVAGGAGRAHPSTSFLTPLNCSVRVWPLFSPHFFFSSSFLSHSPPVLNLLVSLPTVLPSVSFISSLTPCTTISHLLLHSPVLFHPLTPPQTHLREFKLPILPFCSPCPTEEQSSSHTLQGVQCHQDAPSPLLEAGWVQPELCCLLAQASGIVPQAGSCPSKPGAWLQTQQWLPEVRLGIAASCQLQFPPCCTLTRDVLNVPLVCLLVGMSM